MYFETNVEAIWSIKAYDYTRSVGLWNNNNKPQSALHFQDIWIRLCVCVCLCNTQHGRFEEGWGVGVGVSEMHS